MANRLSTASIDLVSYTSNLRLISSAVKPGVKIMAIVKANAYGHGLEHIAKAAEKYGVAYLGVVSVGELRQLRELDIKIPVLILNNQDSESATEAVELGAEITVMDRDIINELQDISQKNSIVTKVHLKIDSGMHRAGCDPKDATSLASLIDTSTNLKLQGIFTHLAESEDPNSEFTDKQIALFNECITDIKKAGLKPELIHCANSAAIFAHPNTHFDMVRPGIMTYGLTPFGEDHPLFDTLEKQLEPVLTLSSKVIFVRELKKGDSVGYNRRWTADRPSKVALIPIGYGDGWRRTPHNAGRVLINGAYAPIVGSVAMDQLVIDVTDLDNVSVGDEVVLIGKQGKLAISAEEVATKCKTINYEIVTALSNRIVRTPIF